MNRMLIVVALFGALCVAGSAVAQGPGGPGGGKKKAPSAAAAQAAAEQDDVKSLEAALQKLRSQLDDVEARLKKSKAAQEPEKKDGFKGFGPKGSQGPGGFGPGGADKKGFGPAFAPGSDGFKGFGKKGFGPGPDGFKGIGKKGFGPDNKDSFKGIVKKEEKAAPPGPVGSASIEDRLDRLLRELEEIRRELRQK
jgi:hypothetical protein